MAQNEMKAMRGMPLRVRSMEGLGLDEEFPSLLDWFGEFSTSDSGSVHW
jgi:hypothetical protein